MWGSGPRRRTSCMLSEVSSSLPVRPNSHCPTQACISQFRVSPVFSTWRLLVHPAVSVARAMRAGRRPRSPAGAQCHFSATGRPVGALPVSRAPRRSGRRARTRWHPAGPSTFARLSLLRPTRDMLRVRSLASLWSLLVTASALRASVHHRRRLVASRAPARRFTTRGSAVVEPRAAAGRDPALGRLASAGVGGLRRSGPKLDPSVA